MKVMCSVRMFKDSCVFSGSCVYECSVAVVCMCVQWQLCVRVFSDSCVYECSRIVVHTSVQGYSLRISFNIYDGTCDFATHNKQ